MITAAKHTVHQTTITAAQIFRRILPSHSVTSWIHFQHHKGHNLFFFGTIFLATIYDMLNFDLTPAFHSFSPLCNLSMAKVSGLSCFPVVKTCCTPPSYSPRRCGEMWSLVTENALSLHCLHSCAWLLLAWRLFIQPQMRPFKAYWGIYTSWATDFMSSEHRPFGGAITSHKTRTG